MAMARPLLKKGFEFRFDANLTPLVQWHCPKGVIECGNALGPKYRPYSLANRPQLEVISHDEAAVRHYFPSHEAVGHHLLMTMIAVNEYDIGGLRQVRR